MKHQIKHKYTNAILFECDVPEDVQASGMATRYALEKAVKDDADLRGSNLRGSNLSYSDLSYSDLSSSDMRYSDLSGSNLSYSDLSGSNLSYSDLSYSNLRGSDLRGSDMRGSDLRGSNLSGSNLSGAKLIGDRPVLMVGPIGSHCDYLAAYLTDKGVRLRAGCFFGDVDTFRAKLEETHGDTNHAAEYRAALVLIEKHAEIWTPKEEAIAKATGETP